MTSLSCFNAAGWIQLFSVNPQQQHNQTKAACCVLHCEVNFSPATSGDISEALF